MKEKARRRKNTKTIDGKRRGRKERIKHTREGERK